MNCFLFIVIKIITPYPSIVCYSGGETVGAVPDGSAEGEE